jgi:hypothetical protein
MNVHVRPVQRPFSRIAGAIARVVLCTGALVCALHPAGALGRIDGADSSIAPYRDTVCGPRSLAC